MKNLKGGGGGGGGSGIRAASEIETFVAGVEEMKFLS